MYPEQEQESSQRYKPNPLRQSTLQS